MQPLEAPAFPESSDDICTLLKELQEAPPEQLVRGLGNAVVRIRVDRDLRSSTTAEGDEVVARIEPLLVQILDHYSGEGLSEVYPWLRELVEVMPKIDVFGLDIGHIREVSADYDEGGQPGGRPADDPFHNVAGDIRQQIHRRLSVGAIKSINELEDYLDGCRNSSPVSGRWIMASPEQKQAERTSPVYQELLKLREQLQLIWGKRINDGQAHEAEAFIQDAIAEIRKIVQPSLRFLERFEVGRAFLGRLQEDLEQLESSRLEGTHFGLTRYHLGKAIHGLMQSENSPGQAIFRLMVLDSILENLSVIYYTNKVNVDFKEVNDENFEAALWTLVDLDLCARATGQGTKNLGRFCLREILASGEVSLKLEKVMAIIQEMNWELVGYLSKTKDRAGEILQGSDIYNSEQVKNRLVNDMVREKTTHLLSNLLDHLRDYLGRGDGQDMAQVIRAIQRAEELGHEFQLEKAIFRFGPDWTETEQDARDSALMGGKGASQAEISRMILDGELTDIDVPKGFGLSPQTWPNVRGNFAALKQMKKMVFDEIPVLETRTGKKFGDPDNPLILATRSGAIVSIPGLLSTVAHIGLNNEIVEGWAATLPEPPRAYHAYIRFIFNYAEDVLNVTKPRLLAAMGVEHVFDLCGNDIEKMQTAIAELKARVPIPDDPYAQLWNSILAVFQSFHKPAVQRVVDRQHIPPKYESACLVQECYPILSRFDCSGVMLTRDPKDGGKGKIEFVHQFGEDLVGGTIEPMARKMFRREYPEAHDQLTNLARTLEVRYSNANDVEFGVRDGELVILQTRRLRLSPMALVIVSHRFFEKGIISREALINRTSAFVQRPLLRTYISQASKNASTPIASGEPISGGAACGRLVFSEDGLEQFPDEKVIYLTRSNVPRDITSQSGIVGYISEEGGATSHAAIVSIGKLPCIVSVPFEEEEDRVVIGGKRFKEGDFVTIDGNDGCVYQGRMGILLMQERNAVFLRAKAAIKELMEESPEESLN